MAGNDYFGFNTTQTRTLQRLLDETVVGQESVGTAELEDGAVTTAKLGPDAVAAANLADNAVVNANVAAAAAVAASKIAVAAGTDGLAADDLQDTLQALRTYVVNLNTWAAALATKLNADAADTGGDSDYDTDPQA